MTNPAKTLSDAAELLRDVNHAAAHHSTYDYPNQVYNAYGAMTALLDRFAQAVHQHAGWITQETDRGGVEVVSGEYVGDAAAAATAVEHHSGQAAGALLDAAQQLREAHNIAGAMASTRDIDDEEGGAQ